MNNFLKTSLVLFLLIGIAFTLFILDTGGWGWALLLGPLYYVGVALLFKPQLSG